LDIFFPTKLLCVVLYFKEINEMKEMSKSIVRSEQVS